MICKTVRLLALTLLCCVLAACAVSFRSGGSSAPREPWKLSEPQNDKEAIIFGSVAIETQDGSKNVPDYVGILLAGKVYGGMGMAGIGEKTVVLDSGTFIATVQPGKYLLTGFYSNAPAGMNTRAASYRTEVQEYTVGAGEIKYIGSLHVRETRKPSFIGTGGEYKLTRVASPSEREQMQWLLEASKGTAWEPKIRKRMGLPAMKQATQRKD